MPDDEGGNGKVDADYDVAKPTTTSGGVLRVRGRRTPAVCCPGVIVHLRQSRRRAASLTRQLPRAPFFRQNRPNSPPGCHIDTVYLDCLPIIRARAHALALALARLSPPPPRPIAVLPRAPSSSHLARSTSTRVYLVSPALRAVYRLTCHSRPAQSSPVPLSLSRRRRNVEDE